MIVVWLAAATVIALGALAIAIVVGFQVGEMRDQLDAASDDADQAVCAVNQVIDHLDDSAPPSTGRHARARDK